MILALDQAGMARSVTESGLPATRYRGVTQAPDGSLYIATDAGEIWRVTPGRERPRTAIGSVTPMKGACDLLQRHHPAELATCRGRITVFHFATGRVVLN